MSALVRVLAANATCVRRVESTAGSNQNVSFAGPWAALGELLTKELGTDSLDRAATHM
jgi:hypothetical protein